MTDPAEESRETQGAIQHLEAALATNEMSEVNYHLRQALQLLDME